MRISSRISSTNRFSENKNGGDTYLRHFYNLSSESEIVMKRSNRTFLFWRCLFYMIGIILLAVGLTLNTKASLGVAPVITLPFVIASILPIDFATATFSVYFIFVCIQLALNRNRPKIKILLQFPSSFFFSLLLRLFGPSCLQYIRESTRLTLISSKYSHYCRWHFPNGQHELYRQSGRRISAYHCRFTEQKYRNRKKHSRL